MIEKTMLYIEIKRRFVLSKILNSTKVYYAVQQIDYVEGKGYTPHQSLLPTMHYRGTGDHSSGQKLILQCISNNQDIMCEMEKPIHYSYLHSSKKKIFLSPLSFSSTTFFPFIFTAQHTLQVN